MLFAPTAEHCAITRVGSEVRKYLKPLADLANWRERERIAAAHPDLFVPFRLAGRVAIQAFASGEGTSEDMRRLHNEIAYRKIAVFDYAPQNILGGRIIDFAIPNRREATLRRREPSSKAPRQLQG